jgi:hypothetical protein
VRHHFHNKKAQGKFINTRLGMGIDKSILFVDAKIAVQEWWGNFFGEGVAPGGRGILGLFVSISFAKSVA